MPDGRCAVLDEMLLAAKSMSFRQCDELAEQLIAARRIYVHGAGRCGLIMRTFAIRLTHLSLPVHVVGDATSPAAASGELLLVGSGSGETGGTIGIARRGHELGLSVAALTTSSRSSLAGIAETLYLIPGVAKNDSDAAERSIQPPGSLFEQLLFCFLEQSIVLLAERLDPDYVAVRRRHANLE